jgi:hypothetical protein
VLIFTAQQDCISIAMEDPYIPKPILDQPEMAIVRATRNQFESAKMEVKVKADTAAFYYRAWQESKKKFGPAGDPKLKRILDIETMLFLRQVDSIVKPAARSYAKALGDAFNAGCTSLTGSFSHEEALQRMLDIQETGLGVGDDLLLLSQVDMANIIDQFAQKIYMLTTENNDPRAFKYSVMCITLANIYQAEDNEWIKKLQDFINNTISKINQNPA